MRQLFLMSFLLFSVVQGFAQARSSGVKTKFRSSNGKVYMISDTCEAPLPDTFLYKKQVLHPRLYARQIEHVTKNIPIWDSATQQWHIGHKDTVYYRHWYVLTMKANPAVGVLHDMYIGSVVNSVDSLVQGMNHVPYGNYRSDPDVLLRMASEYPDSCSAKHAFWRMVKAHPKRQ